MSWLTENLNSLSFLSAADMRPRLALANPPATSFAKEVPTMGDAYEEGR